MKKRGVWVLAALLLAACGCGGPEKDGGAKDPEVSLSALFAAMEEDCGWEEGYMTAVEGELLEEYYPGLSGISTVQLLVRVPAMSSDVNEIALVRCETGEDAEKAAAVLQARIDLQVDGGAWYPETQAAWEKAKVLREGTYAALIASGEHQDALEELFASQFR